MRDGSERRLFVAIDKEFKQHWNWKSPFNIGELELLFFLTGLLFAGTILCFRDYRSAVSSFGDSSAYTGIASAIRHWDFSGLQVKQFWGYPYFMAVITLSTRIPDVASLLL